MIRSLAAGFAILVLSMASGWHALKGRDGERPSRPSLRSERATLQEGGRPIGVSARPGEELFFTTAGVQTPGVPAVVPEGEGLRLKLRLVDAETGKRTPARVNVIGSDGNYYEPAGDENPLADYSLHRTGNREGKGPFRYFGWFFYTSGESTVRVPHGPVRIEVSKGVEYKPVRIDLPAPPAGDTVEIPLERTAGIESFGYYSGDTHLHFTRDGNDATDTRLLDLLSAEDVRVGWILAMNDPRTYGPSMNEQIWPQAKMGEASVRQRGRYSLISSQEYRARTFGHIVMLDGSRLVEGDGPGSDPNNWPPFGLAADQVHDAGGYAIHAHGGYSAGIYADFAQRKTDAVELLQFAEYRGISLEGWYHILNAGFRFPAVGASDYPYCRALCDCRTYVHVEGELSPRKWIEGAVAGRSFFTTGPLVRLEVEGSGPGDVIELSAPRTLKVTVNVESPAAEVRHIDLLVNGQSVRHEQVTGAGPWQIEWEQRIDEPAWLAVRAWSTDARGRPNAEGHTNPVYVNLNGRGPRSAESIAWLLEKLEGRIRYQRQRDFPQRERVLAYYERSRQALLRRAGQADVPE